MNTFYWSVWTFATALSFTLSPQGKARYYWMGIAMGLAIGRLVALAQ